MPSIPSFFAILLQKSSAHDIGEKEDPKWLRYNLQNYPKDVNVQEVVRDIEDFRETAKMMEPRLVPGLLGLVNSLDCGLASKSSEEGHMISTLQRERNMIMQKQKVEGQEFDDINNVKAKDQDVGNYNY